MSMRFVEAEYLRGRKSRAVGFCVLAGTESIPSKRPAGRASEISSRPNRAKPSNCTDWRCLRSEKFRRRQTLRLNAELSPDCLDPAGQPLQQRDRRQRGPAVDPWKKPGA